MNQYSSISAICFPLTAIRSPLTAFHSHPNRSRGTIILNGGGYVTPIKCASKLPDDDGAPTIKTRSPTLSSPALIRCWRPRSIVVFAPRLTLIVPPPRQSESVKIFPSIAMIAPDIPRCPKLPPGGGPGIGGTGAAIRGVFRAPTTTPAQNTNANATSAPPTHSAVLIREFVRGSSRLSDSFMFVNECLFHLAWMRRTGIVAPARPPLKARQR